MSVTFAVKPPEATNLSPVVLDNEAAAAVLGFLKLEDAELCELDAETFYAHCILADGQVLLDAGPDVDAHQIVNYENVENKTKEQIETLLKLAENAVSHAESYQEEVVVCWQ